MQIGDRYFTASWDSREYIDYDNPIVIEGEKYFKSATASISYEIEEHEVVGKSIVEIKGQVPTYNSLDEGITFYSRLVKYHHFVTNGVSEVDKIKVYDDVDIVVTGNDQDDSFKVFDTLAEAEAFIIEKIGSLV